MAERERAIAPAPHLVAPNRRRQPAGAQSRHRFLPPDLGRKGPSLDTPRVPPAQQMGSNDRYNRAVVLVSAHLGRAVLRRRDERAVGHTRLHIGISPRCRRAVSSYDVRHGRMHAHSPLARGGAHQRVDEAFVAVEHGEALARVCPHAHRAVVSRRRKPELGDDDQRAHAVGVPRERAHAQPARGGSPGRVRHSASVATEWARPGSYPLLCHILIVRSAEPVRTSESGVTATLHTAASCPASVAATVSLVQTFACIRP